MPTDSGDISQEETPLKQLSLEGIKHYIKTYQKVTSETEQIIAKKIQEFIDYN